MTDSEIIKELKLRWVNKEEIMEMLGGVSERSARLFIESLNAKLRDECLCVLSTARKTGYHIPNPLNSEDVMLASDILRELQSKAISIFERRQAIEKFAKYATFARENPSYSQPTLF